MPTSAVDQRLEREHLAFTLAVQRAVAPDPSVAACWSPFSVASALGLTATGARGDTRAELAHLLVGDRDGDLRGHAALLAEATRLPDLEAATLRVSNTLWAREDIPIRPEFAEELLSDWPGGAIRDAPFGTDPAAARRLINTDVRITTWGLIPELIQPGALGADTIAALVNALYLKVSWSSVFPKPGTAPRPFEGAGEVATMRLAKQLGYAAAHGWQAVFLPARSGIEGVALLPDAPLTSAEPALTSTILAELLRARVSRQVELYLPKFRVDARADLSAALAGLGVHTLFTRDADLSGISSVPLLVSDVLHQAVLTIDEHGLEGAAATVVMMRAMAMVSRPVPPIVVRIDRPFLFLVRHAESGAVYFMSRVVRPG